MNPILQMYRMFNSSRSCFELLHPSESDVPNEIDGLLDKEEVDEIYPAEEPDHTSEADASFEPLYPAASDSMNEMEDLLYVEEVNEPPPAEEQNNTDYLNYPVLTPSESDAEDEMYDLRATEEVEETNSAKELDNTDYLDYAVLISSESDAEDEMNDLHATEEAEETNSAKELDLVTSRNFDRELFSPSESDFEDEIISLPYTQEENETTFQLDFDEPSESDFEDEIISLPYTEEEGPHNSDDHISEFHKTDQGKVCFITKKSPFSIHVEIDDFLHAPICGDIVQNTFEFLDQNNEQTPQFDTKLFNSTTYYPEQPDCRLVCSKIHEIVTLTDTHTYGTNNNKQHYKSVVVPLHDSPLRETKETNIHSYTSHDFKHIRVPVVVGEYKIEICLEENVVFEEEVMRVKEISKEVVLTNFQFVPTQFSQSLGNGTCTALKGNLFIEGYIHQNIEYTAFHNRNTGFIQKKSVPHSNQLCQKIVLDLLIHLLQVQQVRVSYDGKIPKR